MYEKSERFSLAVSPTELRAIRELARLAGMPSQSALVRRLIVQEARRRGLWAEGREVAHA